MILLAGEVTSRATVDYQKVVRDTIRQIGYDDSSKGVACCIFSLCISVLSLFHDLSVVITFLQSLDLLLSLAQALTLRPAMFLWHWSSSLLTLLRVFTLTVMRRILELGIRSVVITF